MRIPRRDRGAAGDDVGCGCVGGGCVDFGGADGADGADSCDVGALSA
jgi:hypothetical protein